MALATAGGQVAPSPVHGQSCSPNAKRADWLLALIAEQADLRLEEIRGRVAGRGVSTSVTSLWRRFDGRSISFKKRSVHARERPRPDVALAREAWRKNQSALDPAKLVFVDETGTNTAMARLRGRG